MIAAVGTAMNPARRYRARKPITVEAIQWTGSNEENVQAFVGEVNTPAPSQEPWGEPGFAVIRYGDSGQLMAQLWNARDRAWRPVPVGHIVVRGPLGARDEHFFVLAPEDFAIVYETDGADTE